MSSVFSTEIGRPNKIKHFGKVKSQNVRGIQSVNILHIYAHCHGGGAGVICLDFGYGCAAGVPRPNPIHILC